MSEHQKQSAQGYLSSLESTLDLYFAKKAPALPKDIKEIIVKFAPWLVLIGVIISAPGILALFGINAWMYSTPVGYAVGYALGPGYYLSIILLIAVVVLELLSLKGLFARKKVGWNYVFYATLVSLLSALIRFDIVSFIIGAIISFYFIFQIREYYK